MPSEKEVKSILNKSKRRDPWFLDDYTANFYSGCSFNCLFCYIRGSKYGTHMERSLTVKVNALELLERQLHNRAKKNQQGIVVLSSATDPYLQFEEEYELTRQALQLLLKYRFPVHLITRSDLILRDIDILKEIDQQAIIPTNLQNQLNRGVIISFSFSMLNDQTAKIFEPGATPPSTRLKTLQKVKENNFLTGVSMMPLLPFISDTTESLHQMFSSFKKARADYVMPATITLFGNGTSDSKTLVLRAIEKHYPELLPRYEKYFANSYELPAYYRNAFYKKMKELEKEYQLPDRILKAKNALLSQAN